MVAMRQAKKMGNMRQLLSFIPGMKITEEQMEQGQAEMKRFEAIICSMTAQERRDPRLLNAGRRDPHRAWQRHERAGDQPLHAAVPRDAKTHRRPAGNGQAEKIAGRARLRGLAPAIRPGTPIPAHNV